MPEKRTDQQGRAEWDEEDTPTLSQIISMTADAMEQLVAGIIRERTLAPVEELIAQLESSGRSQDEIRISLFSTFGILPTWLMGAGRCGLDSTAMLTWLERNLAPNVSADAVEVGGILGLSSPPLELTINEAVDQLGPRFIPTIAAMAAAVAATAGHGDAYWLRQFDPDPDSAHASFD
jgi:hypothetical protein